MKFKSVIKKRMAPILKEHGYRMEEAGPYLSFHTKNDERVIVIGKRRYYLNKLDIRYSVRTEKVTFGLDFDSFKEEFCHASKLTYSNQREFEHYIDEVTQATVTTIIPYLDIMEKNYVEIDFQMYEDLSKDTVKRAQDFADRWNLPMKPEIEIRKRLNDIMDGMRKDISNRKNEFYQNREEIINLTAYYGEILLISWDKSGHWEWEETNGKRVGYLIEKQNYDVLRQVINAWNFGHEHRGITFLWIFEEWEE